MRVSYKLMSSALDRFAKHERGISVVVHPSELELGPYGAHVLQQLLSPAVHTGDDLQPQELLEHFCREAQPHKKEGKPEACPNLHVRLGARRSLILEGPCRDCLLRFLGNMEAPSSPKSDGSSA